MLEVIFLFINLGFAILIFYLTISFITGAPFVPTTNNAVKSIIKQINLKSGQTVADLGSGNGKILVAAAKVGAYADGYEINPFLVLYSLIIAVITKTKSKINVYWKNFWKADLKKYDVIFVYLLPWKMEKLEQKIIKESKPNALIVSNSFVFPHLKLVDKDEKNHIYYFRIK